MRISRKDAREMGLYLPPAEKKKYGHDGKKNKLAGKEEKVPCRDFAFDAMCKAHGLPLPESEVTFFPGRKWRLDHVFDGWLAVEIQGGVWTDGHHSGGQSQIDDMEKLNHAVLKGYAVLQFTPDQMKDGSAFAFIVRVLKGGEDEQH